MFKFNKRTLVSSLTAGFFITLFTGYFVLGGTGEYGGIFLGWYPLDTRLPFLGGEFIINVLLWTAISSFIIQVFIKKRIPF